MRKFSQVLESVATVFFEGPLEDWKAHIHKYHPTAHIGGSDVRGYFARVDGLSRGEDVGSVRQIKPGVFRGGYRTALQSK